MDFNLPSDQTSLQNITKALLDIREGFRDEPYGAYKAMRINKPNEDTRPLSYLAQQKIADVFGYPTEKSALVYVYNRYRFDCLLTAVFLATGDKKLKPHADPEGMPNIVVYDPDKGVGFINGNRINFRRKQNKINKKIFDALFFANSEGITEDKLKSLVGMTGINGTAAVLETNAAITNLRKICGVNNEVIRHRGRANLDALTFRPENALVDRLLRR